ncbi:MAG: hypothetical protein GWN31_13070 [Candidatus Thorarchaeota archaeon]|nr:hypothetical protein [Candidatus Thorarchaeota archaeon]NIW52878.1 hypothetical protein [Candidatus Korarchaeota archaeon]
MSAEKNKKSSEAKLGSGKLGEAKLGRVSGEIQAGVDKGYLGALDESDPYVKQLKEINKNHKCVVSVRDTKEEKAGWCGMTREKHDEIQKMIRKKWEDSNA